MLQLVFCPSRSYRAPSPSNQCDLKGTSRPSIRSVPNRDSIHFFHYALVWQRIWPTLSRRPKKSRSPCHLCVASWRSVREQGTCPELVRSSHQHHHRPCFTMPFSFEGGHPVSLKSMHNFIQNISRLSWLVTVDPPRVLSWPA